jgi:hypothetical protein
VKAPLTNALLVAVPWTIPPGLPDLQPPFIIHLKFTGSRDKLDTILVYIIFHKKATRKSKTFDLIGENITTF